jgi:hypothetical protein
MNKSIKGEIVKKYLTRFPKTPQLTLAKKIYKENSKLFGSIETTRARVRYYCGKMGASNRKLLADKTHVKKEEQSKNPFDFIPEAYNDEPKTWKLPKNFKRVLVISDIHIPYHEPEAIKRTLKYAKDEGVDCVYINGDLLDFHDLSFHEKDARKRPTIASELEMGRKFLKGLKDYLGVPVYFKPANHEHRLERYLRVKAVELLDCEEFKLDVLLRLGEMGIQYIGRRDKCYFGKLLVEHGDRIKGSGGVSPARTLFQRYKRHAICGHFHKKTEHCGKVYDGNSIVTYSVGSLCSLEPEYFEVNEHVHGFAIVEMDGDDFRVHNYAIEGGKVY